MNKSIKKFVAILSAVAVICCAAIPAFATDITTDGGNGTTPVNLSSTVDGTLDGDPAATALSVTIPTSLPLAMSVDGDIATADNAKITNNSFGAVRVKTATISGANGWTLVAFGNKNTLAAEKVDSNKLGFSMSIGNGDWKNTNASGNTQTFISAPVEGCYMTGVGDTANNFATVDYDAIATAVSEVVTAQTVANVVFVVEFDTVG